LKKEKEKTEIAPVETSAELNEEYLTDVHENAYQEEVKFLTGIIAEWNVRESSKFEARRKPFTTVFKSNKGIAKITYDSQGRVSRVEKKLENVVLPSQITKVVFKRYEDWTIVKNKFSLSYKEGQDVEKTYELTLVKGDEKKKIKINA
jgi:hypothetical protein